MTYTTVQDVANELQVTISSATTPSKATVEQWIEFAKAEIDSTTGFTFEPKQALNVYVYGNGSKEVWIPRKYTPVISIDTVQVNAGTDFAESLTSLTADTQYFITDKVGGAVKFAPTVTVKNLEKSVKFGTIIYGYEEVPTIVKSLATKIASLRYIRSQIANTNTTLTQAIQVGPIRVRNDSSQVVNYVAELKGEIESLYMQVGTFKTYMN